MPSKGQTVKAWYENNERAPEKADTPSSSHIGPGGARDESTKITEEIAIFLLDLFELAPDLTLQEAGELVKDEEDISLSTSAISAFLLTQERPWRRKRFVYFSAHTSDEDVLELYNLWSSGQKENVFFEDEFSIFLGQARTTGRAPAGKRPKRQGDVSRTDKVNVAVTISRSGVAAQTLYWRDAGHKGINSATIVQHLQSKEVRENEMWIGAACSNHLLPTAAPQFSPAELYINYAKSVVRAAGPRTKEGVISALEAARKGASSVKCAGFFDHAFQELQDRRDEIEETRRQSDGYCSTIG
jgi:hypothetical protein